MNPVNDHGVVPKKWPTGLYIWTDVGAKPTAQTIVLPGGEVLYRTCSTDEWEQWHPFAVAAPNGWERVGNL